MSDPRLRRLIPLAALAALALAFASCGSDGGDQESSSAAAVDAAPPTIPGVPKPLAENRAQANQLISGGTEALDEKLAELRGHPVVVNQWASWCPPCRAEFPFFQDSAGSHAKEIAFVGVDMEDSRDAAEEFLRQNPVPYPHIEDPDRSAIASLGGGFVSPTTAFIDERGEVVHVFEGAYASRDQLEADIDEHLLGGARANG